MAINWNSLGPLDKPFARTRFGAHRFTEHLLDNHTGTELAGEYAGCQNYAVKDGKAYVAFGYGPNVSPNYYWAQNLNPALQGIFEFDGPNITKVQDFTPDTFAAFGVCLDRDGNFAYDDDGWAAVGTTIYGGIDHYSGPYNSWNLGEYAVPRLIGGEVVFSTHDTFFLGGRNWLVKDTREAVIARSDSWPPVLERFDASDSNHAVDQHLLGDIRQDSNGTVWAFVIRIQSRNAHLPPNSDVLDPRNYAAVVKVPPGLSGQCEVWWEATGPNVTVPWPSRAGCELEVNDPNYIFMALNRMPSYLEPHRQVAWPGTDDFRQANTWWSFYADFWRLDKHSKTQHILEDSRMTGALTGALQRYQDVLIADTYYDTITIRHPDGTWHEERADAGDESFRVPGDPQIPDLYGNINYNDAAVPLDRSYFDFIRIGPSNGTDLYAQVEYTQASGNGGSDSGDWVRYTPDPTAVAQPAILTAAIGPAGYYI